MAFYLQIPSITGSVTDSQHKGWIGVHDIHFHTANHASVKPGHTSDRITSIPAVSNFVLSKLTDVASPKILEASLSGKVFDKVVIHVCNTDEKPYIEYTLHKAIVSQYDMNATDSDTASHSHLQEMFSLNATKIEMRYMPQGGAPLSTAYDQEKVAFS
jgi:type VI secretion system Hcp family effector